MTRKELIELCRDVVAESRLHCEREPENSELDRDLKFYQVILGKAENERDLDIEDFIETYLYDFV